MLKFNKSAAQGEVYIRKIEVVPGGSTESVKPEGGKFIIGHSETGHHHTMVMDRVSVVKPKSAPAGMNVLYAILDVPNALVHERDFDTHPTISLEPGIYEFRSGREFDHYEDMARKQAD